MHQSLQTQPTFALVIWSLLALAKYSKIGRSLEDDPYGKLLLWRLFQEEGIPQIINTPALLECIPSARSPEPAQATHQRVTPHLCLALQLQ